MQGNERLPSDKDKTGQKAAEGQGQNGSKGCRGTRSQGNERLLSDKDATGQKARVEA